MLLITAYQPIKLHSFIAMDFLACLCFAAPKRTFAADSVVEDGVIEMATTATTNHALSKEQVAQFHRDGYLSPLTFCSPDEMADLRGRLEAEVFEKISPHKGCGFMQSRHLDSRLVWEICSHPSIVEKMASIMGPDLILWRSNFFNKTPGAKSIPWHQDFNYWPLDPALNISAWLAIDRATVANSCVQIIPGSHRKIVPHIAAGDEYQFKERAHPDHYDEGKAEMLELEPGQFFLFNERTLHFSEPNSSDERRTGLAVRVTVPFVKVHHDELFEAHRNIVLCGNDYMGFNKLQEPPAE